MKMYNKSDLKLVNGMLVSADGDIIMPDVRIVKQANSLETLSQKVAYLAAQPSATPMPSLDGFERKSINDDVVNGAKFMASTPRLDSQVAKTMMLMEELDDVNTVNEANRLLSRFAELLEFVNGECVIDRGGDAITKFDTPTLGSVLELTQKDITSVVALASGLEGDPDCNDCSEDDYVLHPGDLIGVRRITREEMSEDEIKSLLNIIAAHDEDAAEALKSEGMIGIRLDDKDKDVESE